MTQLGTAKWSAALLGVALLVFQSPESFAGRNHGASLLLHAGAVTKSTPATCTALGALTSCTQLLTNITAPAGPLQTYIGVYVGVSSGTMEVAGVDFGIQFNDQALSAVAWTKCGDVEVPTTGDPNPAWPTTGSGNTVVWSAPVVDKNLVLVGYFTLAAYTGYGSMVFQAGAHPLYSVARILDPQSNFDDLKYPATADLSGGNTGANPSCEVPVKPTTWGGIKSLYGR